MKLEIEVPDEMVEKFGRFMKYKKLCGDMNPDINPVDAVCAIVFESVLAFLRKFKSAGEKP